MDFSSYMFNLILQSAEKKKKEINFCDTVKIATNTHRKDDLYV